MRASVTGARVQGLGSEGSGFRVQGASGNIRQLGQAMINVSPLCGEFCRELCRKHGSAFNVRRWAFSVPRSPIRAGLCAVVVVLLAAFRCAPLGAQTAAPRPQSLPPVKARLLLREGGADTMVNREVTLLGRTPDALLAQAVSGGSAPALIARERVLRCAFEPEYDRSGLIKALQGNDWAAAVRTLAPALRPALPYLDLPENDAFDLVMDLGTYMTSSAASELRAAADDGARTRALKQFEAAVEIFRTAARADWAPFAPVAILKGCLAQLAMGRDGAAANSLERVAPPETDEATYGHYWLVKGELLRRAGKPREALEAVVKSIVFADKDAETFPSSLLLSADCYTALGEHHRARDVYYEVAVLFTGTDWERDALAGLKTVMDGKRTLEEEKKPLEYVFFNVSDDMNELAEALLKEKGLGAK